MNQTTAIQRLADYDRKGRYVFTSNDLGKIFYEDSPRSVRASIQRMVRSGILTRAIKGVFVNNLSQNRSSSTLELIAKALRRGEYSYISLESALSEYGAISQIPIDRITVMTTGRKGEYKTPYGVIEFTHTKRSVNELIDNILEVNRPLRMAKKDIAYRDLKRVGRNLHLVDKEDFYND